MRNLLILLSVVLSVAFGGTQVMAENADDIDRTSTGGATTLEDILRRQEIQNIHGIDNSYNRTYRRDNMGQDNLVIPESDALGTRGSMSDSDIWRDIRYGTADMRTEAQGPAANFLIQDTGMTWYKLREGYLVIGAGYTLIALVVILLMFYAYRGKIMIEGEKTGVRIQRFGFLERFAHWLMGGSFVMLALTGIVVLFGRMILIPVMGKDAYAALAEVSKMIHNNIAWAFIVGLVIVTFRWMHHNIPNRDDLKWLAVGGGLFSKGVHPPARKFNAGQKIVFWGVMVLGYSIVVSGVSLLFPFEFPIFGWTFNVLNQTGLPQLVGLGVLPTELTPAEDMQYAQMWHLVVAFAFIALIIGHIYIGSFGMEGAFDAMGTGDVELQWAREHHSIWVEEVEKAQASKDPAKSAPAE